MQISKFEPSTLTLDDVLYLVGEYQKLYDSVFEVKCFICAYRSSCPACSLYNRSVKCYRYTCLSFKGNIAGIQRADMQYMLLFEFAM